MEKFADKVESFLDQQLKLYESLQLILEEEKQQIVNMDVDGLWNKIKEKKDIFQNLEHLNHEIENILNLRAAALGEHNNDFSLSDLIQRMPVSLKVKSNLRQVKQGLELCKKNVITAAKANKQYIQESLVVINDIFSIAVHPIKERQYGNSGRALAPKEATNLINTEA